MSSSFDAVENRARHAAKGLNMMTSTIQFPPLPTDAPGRRPRSAVALVVAAAVVTLIAVATAIALRGGSTQRSTPAFEPTRLPDGARVSPAFRPAASYELPIPHELAVDEPDHTMVDLGRAFPLASGYLEIAKAGPLPDAATAGDRVRVLHRQATSVGGDRATRFVVQVLPHPGDDYEFCADTKQTQCIGMPPLGRVTLYFVQHDHATVIIAGGAGNDRLGAAVGRVADSVAATWQWTEQ